MFHIFLTPSKGLLLESNVTIDNYLHVYNDDCTFSHRKKRGIYSDADSFLVLYTLQRSLLHPPAFQP